MTTLLNTRILASLGMIVFVAAAWAGATGAFFSDTETSTGNTFTAGEIDLQIDNSSYGFDWNNPGDDTDETLDGDWIKNTSNSWDLSDLTNQLFFSFVDLKPGDYGEDTISMHVQNDAWACMAMDLGNTPDNGINEPEAGAGDVTDGDTGGELQNYLSFIFWRDDGDNVLEVEEEIIEELTGAPGEIFTGDWLAIADSGTGDGPLEAAVDEDDAEYIGKGWCFGTLTPTPEAQQENAQGPTPGNTGFTCSGVGNHNDAQTDGIFVDVEFYSEQARNNDEFLCENLNEEEPQPVTSLSLAKTVTPANVAADALFTLTATGPTNLSGIEGSPGASGPVTPGAYTLGETGGPPGATATWSCVGNSTPEGANTVTILANEQVSCEVTNTYAITQCTDGVDNEDTDQLVDQADPQCHTDGDAQNSSSYDPTINSEGPGQV